MELERNQGIVGELKSNFNGEIPQPSAHSVRSKSANRIRYEAEAALLKRKLGDLDSIRMQLGLSQRKMCQLLFVDPSAWTRWVRRGEDAPPYVYRALQWYLALQDKYPALDVNFWLGTATRSDHAQISNVNAELRELESKVTRLELEKATLQGIQASGERQASEISRLRRNVRLLVFGNLIFAATLIAILLLLVRG